MATSADASSEQKAGAGDAALSVAVGPEHSVYEQLLETIQAHVAKERAAVVSYRRLADTNDDPVVRFLMGFVADDEQRHHDLLRVMAANLGDTTLGSGWCLPTGLDSACIPTKDEIETVRSLMREEQAHYDVATRLARDHRGLYAGLFSVLFGVIATDSQKHQRVLELVLRRMEEQRRASIVLLEQDRRLGDQLSELNGALANGHLVAGSIEAASAALVRHIYVEEEMVLPKLGNGRFDDEVAAAIREHGEMTRLLDLIGPARATPGTSRVQDIVRQVLDSFEQHRHAAELVIYPALDWMLDDDALDLLLRDAAAAQPPSA